MVPELFSTVITALLAATGLLVAVIFIIRRKTLPSERRRKLRPYRIACIALLVAAGVVYGGRYFYIHNQKPEDMGNPFFTGWDTPFGAPPFDRMLPEYFQPAFEEGMRIQKAEIDSIIQNPAAPDFDNVILAYDRSGELLDQVGKIFFGITAAETNDELEKIKARMSPLLSKHSDEIAMNPLLFEKIKAVYDARGGMNLNQAQARLLERVYTQFVRNGALLGEDEKAELARINEELSSLGVSFGNNKREAINAFELVIDPREGTGLPSNVSSRARARAKERGHDEKLLFTLQKPSWLPFLTYSDNQDLRRQLYEAYLGLCAEGTQFDNTQIINDIVRLRMRKAHLLGFENYADFVLDERMAKKTGNVYALLDDIWTPALEKATEERDVLREMKRNGTGNPEAELSSWDWWFYAERLRKSHYNFDEEQARLYFALENVKAGIFQLCNRLYGISFRPVKVPVYHKDVSVYEVLDFDNSHLGLIYMDFHPRPGKGAGAWCGSYRSQGYDRDGNRISPITTIVCNFTEPLAGTPSLLTLDEVETFFHEFGHAIHNLFANVPYKGLLGTERDFVELPSQIMENWAFEPRMLKNYAIQFRSGEPIPDRIVQKIQETALFNQGFNTVELLAASYSDMDIHSLKEFVPFNVSDFERYALATKRGLIPEIEPRYRFPYFSHIFDGGYAAGYYGYIWAEVLDKDAYEAFVESGDIFDKQVAGSFRYKVLAPRGLKDGMDLFKDFRGREPSRVPLFRARGLWNEPPAEADSLPAKPQPRESPPDSILREILDEGPLVE